MAINNSPAGAVISGLAAGVIYSIIAVATGASALGSLSGAIIVAAIAVAIGFAFRALYKRKASGPSQ